jgi:hypothetical protein
MTILINIITALIIARKHHDRTLIYSPAPLPATMIALLYVFALAAAATPLSVVGASVSPYYTVSPYPHVKAIFRTLRLLPRSVMHTQL